MESSFPNGFNLIYVILASELSITGGITAGAADLYCHAEGVIPSAGAVVIEHQFSSVMAWTLMA